MKIAYILVWNLEGNSPIEKKVALQTHKWRELGHEVKVFAISRNKVDQTVIREAELLWKTRGGNFLTRYSGNGKIYEELESRVRDFNPDFIYFRNSFYHAKLARLLKKYPSCMEVNGLPMKEALIGFFSTPYKTLVSAYVFLTYRAMLGMGRGKVCVSHEIRDTLFGNHDPSEVIVIPNSIEIPENNDHQTKSHEIPRLLYVCGPVGHHINPKHHYHAVDKIVRLATRTVGKMEIMVVGDNGESFTDSNLPDNIRFRGILHNEQYHSALEWADVGLGVAGLHRKGMHEASPLRVRDYATVGLPMILPYKETAFAEEDTPEWVMKLPNQEDNLDRNADDIADFVSRMKGYKVPLAERKRYFGTDHWESRRLAFMESLVESQSSH
ncbi:MAG: glycosyltransferase [Luteolibacter sp.]